MFMLKSQGFNLFEIDGLFHFCKIFGRCAWLRGYITTWFRVRGTGCTVSRVRVHSFEGTGYLVSHYPLQLGGLTQPD